MVHVKKNLHPGESQEFKAETKGKSRQESDKENEQVYIQAIQQWNRLDGSKRPKIPVPKTPSIL